VRGSFVITQRILRLISVSGLRNFLLCTYQRILLFGYIGDPKTGKKDQNLASGEKVVR